MIKNRFFQYRLFETTNYIRYRQRRYMMHQQRLRECFIWSISFQKQTKSIKIEKKIFIVFIQQMSISYTNNFFYKNQQIIKTIITLFRRQYTYSKMFQFMINWMSFCSKLFKNVIFISLILTNSTICKYREKYETFNERKFCYFFNIIQSLK